MPPSSSATADFQVINQSRCKAQTHLTKPANPEFSNLIKSQKKNLSVLVQQDVWDFVFHINHGSVLINSEYDPSAFIHHGPGYEMGFGPC